VFVFASIAAGIATALPVWAALLIVTALLFALAAIAGLVARALFERTSSPLPERAIDEAKRVGEAIRP
jgi:hypothetical protein